MKRNFLIVAADTAVRDRLGSELKARGFSVTLAASACEATRVVRNVAVDSVLVESQLPDSSPGELADRIRQLRPKCQVSVLTSFERIRNTPDQMRFGPDDWLLHGDQLFDLLASPIARESATDPSQAERGCDALIQVVDVLVGLKELDDRYFGGTSHQVMRLVRSVAEALTDEPQTVQEIVLATLLRDIGKSAIETDDNESQGDRDVQRKAVSASQRLIEHIDFPWKVMPVIRHHHERYDGTGYPDGLRGREIPMGARIVAVVDAWVSMTSAREHRAALEPEQALRELIASSGKHFDPEVVEVFQRVLDQASGSRLGKSRPVVLVVEPQQDFRRLLRMRMLNEGFEVKVASNNETAIGMILKLAPDLVIADVDADATETFNLLEELRGDQSLCRTPVIFLSNNTDRLVKIRALRAGVDEFLGKKQGLEEIVAHVENIVTRERIRREGGSKQRKGIQGDLEDLGLPDLVQTLVIGMKTACISLDSRGREGHIWFENGAPRHAAAPGGLNGEDAFFEMLAWPDGEFNIEHGVKAKFISIEQDATFLLMEGLRRLDESGEQQRAPAAS